MRFIITAQPGKNSAPADPNAPFDEQLFSAYMKFNEEMHKAGVLVAVERLQPSANGTRLRMSNGQFRTVDGPFTETNELIAGVNILEVASREEAITWIKRCPTLCGPSTEAEFEIRPVLEVPEE